MKNNVYAEPFIILPQGKRQECLFWGNEHFKAIESDLLKMSNCGIGNTRVNTNVIRGVVHGNLLYVVHLYPTSVRETFSGRSGQKAIIGFAIRRSGLFFSFSRVVTTVDSFFKAVEHVCNRNIGGLYTPNVLMRNACNENFFLEIDRALSEEGIIEFISNEESLNEKIVGLYKQIRIKSIFYNRFSVIRENEEYKFCTDKDLDSRLSMIEDF
jgi:hypothetical protein